MITPTREQVPNNAEAFGRAVAQFQGELNELIASGENGSVRLTLHIGDAKITRQEIDRRRFPK